ncbi:MAG: hypothetical protein IPP72_08740 [Chitinophagaceae bacterium]|nr:hypothetical protein [Chitinophagaceae bacterium]
MRIYFIVLLLIVSKICPAQRELIHARDPASIRTELVTITHFNLPESYSRYAGIRFIDARWLKAFSGFIQQNAKAGFRKISTSRLFEEELNSAVKIKHDSSTIVDSIVVVLKNFWMSRNSVKDQEMSCHVKALFFTKRADSFFFRGKMDTLLKRHAIVQYEYKDLPAFFIEDMLNAFPLQQNHYEKRYLKNDFVRLALQQKQPPVDSLKDSGLFLSFSDFLKGRLYNTSFSLSDFKDQYRISFERTGEGEALAAKIWGCLYNGQLYIKNGKHYSKAFAAENTFLLLGNVKTTAQEDTSSSPVIVNMETGKLE